MKALLLRRVSVRYVGTGVTIQFLEIISSISIFSCRLGSHWIVLESVKMKKSEVLAIDLIMNLVSLKRQEISHACALTTHNAVICDAVVSKVLGSCE